MAASERSLRAQTSAHTSTQSESSASRCALWHNLCQCFASALPALCSVALLRLSSSQPMATLKALIVDSVCWNSLGITRSLPVRHRDIECQTDRLPSMAVSVHSMHSPVSTVSIVSRHRCTASLGCHGWSLSGSEAIARSHPSIASLIAPNFPQLLPLVMFHIFPLTFQSSGISE